MKSGVIMKKTLSLFLTVVFCLSLCACGKKDPESDGPTSSKATQAVDTTKPTEPPKTPQELLESAGEKLKSANSFAVSISQKQEALGQVAEMDVVSVLFNTTADGIYTYLHTEGYDSSRSMTYVKGNVGYICDYYGPSDSKNVLEAKTFFDFAYDKGFLFQHLTNGTFREFFGDDTMFERFFKLNPAVTTDEAGITTFYAKDLTLAQFATVFENMGGEDENARYDIGYTVNAEGYLQSHILGMSMTAEDGTVMRMSILLTYSRIGEQIEIEAPNWDTMTKAETLEYVHYITKDCAASYISGPNITAENGGVPAFRFGGLFGTAPEVYKVNATEDGLPVYVNGGYAGSVDPSACTPKKLIIPVGVIFTDMPWYNGAALFFEDTKENVTAHFADGWNDENNFYADVYYAGQWSYVNEIPTPNQ